MSIMTNRVQYELFTDGACLGNPGPGGWAFILRSEKSELVQSGGDPDTTNQRMEVTAVLRALESLTEPAAVEIHADSKYVTDGLTKWMDGWLQKNWKNAAKKPVKNQDLWKPLAALREKHTITTYWVKGHAGHAENERCDTLASAEAEKFLQ
ncbi:MAG: ribonuclease HI [Phycisphaerales bacterium]|jgi:ribonuclease HI|nr:ribonuclease HI [Phycisphaerales bacterium]